MADSDNYENGCVLWVTSQDVKSSCLDRTTTQITEKGAKELTLYPAGSLVMVTRSGILRHTLPVAELRKPSTVNQDIRVILPQDACCGGWLLRFFISRNKELLLEFGKTGTTVESVDFGKIKDMLLCMPNSVEQQQIGRFFAKLDDLITLHQRECGKPPFNQSPAWEQRKLGDCFEFLKNNTLSRADLNGENGTARNVHYGDILIKFGDCLDGERSDLPFITDDTVLPKFAGSILREGDVIFADTAEDEAAGKCVELRKLPKEPTISGLHTIPARPRFPFGSGYLGHYLNSDAYHRQLLPLMQGIKVISVSKAALHDTQVRFPRLSEQAAIGAALSEIDNLITLHQRMCPIFSFCAHESRTNFAQTLQGWLQILRYPRPIPKMLVSPSAPASGVFGTAKGAFICASSSAGASTSSPSARKNFITSSTLCCRESLSSP